jgi:hypothetical protein
MQALEAPFWSIVGMPRVMDSHHSQYVGSLKPVTLRIYGDNVHDVSPDLAFLKPLATDVKTVVEVGQDSFVLGNTRKQK